MIEGYWTKCFIAYREYQLYYGGNAPTTYAQWMNWWGKYVPSEESYWTYRC